MCQACGFRPWGVGEVQYMGPPSGTCTFLAFGPLVAAASHSEHPTVNAKSFMLPVCGLLPWAYVRMCACVLVCKCFIKGFLWPQFMFFFLFTVFLSNPLPQVPFAVLLPKCCLKLCAISLLVLKVYFCHKSLGN